MLVPACCMSYFFCNLFWCIAPENSNQSEMPQCVGDTVVVDGVRHVIRGLFHLVRGIAHRDADSRMAQHRNVVAAVSERHRFAERNVVPGQDFVDAGAFVVAANIDIGESGVPAARTAVREDRAHQCCLFFGADVDIYLEHLFAGDLVQVPHGEADRARPCAPLGTLGLTGDVYLSGS